MNRWGIALLLFLLSAAPALALIPSISNVPISINYDQEFTVDVSLSPCSDCGNSYLRGVFFYPETSNSYSGFTQNNSSEWVESSSDRTKYFFVPPDQIDQSTWSGQLKFKFNSQKPGGEYFFKVSRYTSAGDESADWSEKSPINVVGPPPTPTSTPVPTPIPTSIPPTSTPKPPTPTPKPSSTPKPTSTPTLSPTKIPVTVTVTVTNPTVLGEADEFFSNSSPTPIPIPGKPANDSASPPWPAILLISLGTAGLSVSAFLFFRSRS